MISLFGSCLLQYRIVIYSPLQGLFTMAPTVGDVKISSRQLRPQSSLLATRRVSEIFPFSRKARIP
jgi:hypothetical protein